MVEGVVETGLSEVPALNILLPLPLPPLTFLPPLAAGATYSRTGVGAAAWRGPVVGRRVAVPWQGGVRTGVVVELTEVNASRATGLKHALNPLGESAWLSEAALKAIMRLAAATGAPPGTVLATLNPPGFNTELTHELSLLDGAEEALARAGFVEQGGEGSSPKQAGSAWFGAPRLPVQAAEFLRAHGLIDERAKEHTKTRPVLVPRRAPDEALMGEQRRAQRRALELLVELGEVESAAELARRAGVSSSSARRLVSRGYAAYEQRPEPPPEPLAPLTPRPETGWSERLSGAPTPHPALDRSLSLITGGRRLERLALLVPTIRRELNAGRSVLLIAPEQADADRSAAFLSAELRVDYLTGEATDAQRLSLWRTASEGPRLIVGTYLALLAPVANLGRVILLEAGSSAYKLRSGARLVVARAARYLAEEASAPLTLTDPILSAELDPLVEEEARITLPPAPLRLHVANLNEGGNWPLHADLIMTLKQVAERERQAVLLAPRRGYSGAFGCTRCGWQAPCPNCDLPLRHHRHGVTLRCHQCGHGESAPPRCKECGGSEMEALSGAGTEWVSSRLNDLLPGMPVYRYDRDQRDDLTPLFGGLPGVVVGTLAVLSLPPLPELSLIGVTHFDTHLAAADFRAEDEAARMILRLTELSGRRRPLVVVQTHSPSHPLLEALTAAEPAPLLEEQLRAQLGRRRAFGYPPYAVLAKLQFTARDRASAQSAAQSAADALLTHGAANEEVIGPASAPVERVGGRYVFHLLLRATTDGRLMELLGQLPRSYPRTRLIVDVDPHAVGALLE